MAGTLTITTLSDGTNSTSSTNCIKGSAKAWVSFNGSTSAIRGSYNVSSITKNGTGNYFINFTSALSSANYAVTGIGSHVVGVVALFSVIRENTRTASGYQIDYFTVGSTYADTIDAYTAAFI
jgi:hypothetical protein